MPEDEKKTDDAIGLRELWRDLFAPSAARLALLAVVRQIQREKVSRDDFLAMAGASWDEVANLATSDDETTPPSDDRSEPTT